MSAATRRFVGASRAATRIISRHRKAKAWGVEWARARDSKPWRSSSVNLSGDAKGMGIVVLLTKREGHRYCCRVSMPSHDSLCLEKTDEGFTKWTSRKRLPAGAGYESEHVSAGSTGKADGASARESHASVWWMVRCAWPKFTGMRRMVLAGESSNSNSHFLMHADEEHHRSDP